MKRKKVNTLGVYDYCLILIILDEAGKRQKITAYISLHVIHDRTPNT
jgi:hypothetical protein